MTEHRNNASRPRRTFYYPAASLLVLLLPELLRFGVPFWRSDRPAEAPLVCLGFVGSLALGALAGTRRLRRLALGLAGLVAVVAAAGAVSVLMPNVLLSRGVVALQIAIAAVLIIGSEIPSRALRAGLVSALAAVGGAALVARPWSDGGEDAVMAATTIFTNYYAVEVRDHGPMARPADLHPGGGLALLDTRVLAMTGGGVLFRLDRSADGSVHSTRLPLDPPVDLTAFEPSMVAGGHPESVRATDVLARRVGDNWQIVASHQTWNASDRCVNLAVSSATMSANLDTVIAGWSRLATMQPCLSAERVEPGGGFQGQMGGGRMAWHDGALLITVGDHGFDGVGRPLTVAQLDEYDYGKTRLIDLDSGTVHPFTKGNRNPQGLFIDPIGRIWSTEHGPRGGDELNLLTQGGNYGWPFATFGTAYELLSWPPADLASPDPSFMAPTFAWVPSVGISNLVGVNADRFPRWKGNLLVGSLAGESLYRVGLDGIGVRFVERIPIGVHIRDVIELPDGDVWIWTDRSHVLTMRPAAADARAATAFTACTGCHRTAAGGSGGIGPNLAGIIDRDIASEASYPGYSEALRGLDGAWTPERLDAFLSDPAAVAPGSTMSYRVSSPEDRAAIIAYLRSQR